MPSAFLTGSGFRIRDSVAYVRFRFPSLEHHVLNSWRLCIVSPLPPPTNLHFEFFDFNFAILVFQQGSTKMATPKTKATGSYFTRDTFRFLLDLQANNDRDWFLANKDRYESSARHPFLRCIADCSNHLA